MEIAPSDSSGKPARIFFPQLTGLRAVAAYLIYIHHFNPFESLKPWTLELHIGVNVFFVLSGFLIALRYQDKLNLDAKSLKTYFGYRFARVYPMYILLTLATFAAKRSYPTTGGLPLTDALIANLTMVRGFFAELKFTGIAQGWSLTVEECFYLLAPLIFSVARKHRRLWSQAFAIVLGGLFLSFVVQTGLANNPYGFFGTYTFELLYTFPGRCIEFFVGIQLARVLASCKASAKKVPWTALGVAGMAAIVALLASLQGPDYAHGLYHPGGIVLANVVLPWFVAMLIGGLVVEETMLSRLLARPLWVRLGQSSYVFYLIHMGFLQEALFTVSSDMGLAKPATFFCVFFALNVVSLMLFSLVEEPLNQAIRSQVGGHSRSSRRGAPRGNARSR